MIQLRLLRIIIYLIYCRVTFGELKVLQTVFRHGNRMPTRESFYPKDPYINYTYEPDGRGGLTSIGKMSAYKLGQYFRERYDQFLGSCYTKKDIWFRADEVDRIVMTGELVAAGLYPPCNDQRWNSQLNWQPIPVWAPPISNDYLYNGVFCKNYKKWRENVEKTDQEVIEFETSNRDIYEYLSNKTGGNITQSRVLGLRQYLYAQRDIGLKLPKWTKSVFSNGKLDELAEYDIVIRTRTPELKQLLGGVWLLEWLNHIDNHLNKNDTRKAFMYAAHELNIAAILTTLDNYDNEIPSYSSSLMFELHKQDNGYYVQILYRNNGKIRILTFPDCDDAAYCPLDVFRKYIKPFLPNNPKTACGQEGRSTSLYQ